MTGAFENTATFGSVTLTSTGESDIFVGKYGPGACCLANASCVELGPSDCDLSGGTFVGGVCAGDVGVDGVDDAIFSPQCVSAIPTVSAWGLVVLALLLLTGAKLVFIAGHRACYAG